jgi:tetratricopeptide (TPR) repeat protein
MHPATASPDDALALVQDGWRRLRHQSPQAAWAAWQEALRIDPEQPAAREALDRLAAASDLPPAARRVYRLRSPEPAARSAWDARLREANLADVDRARATFAALAADRPDDAAARYNLGICLAWSDRNAEAVPALYEASRLDAAAGRPEQAAEAITLAEVLRHGAGAEHLADDVRCALALDWPAALGDPVAALARLGPCRVLPVPPKSDGGPIEPPARRVEWLDRPMPAPSDDLEPEALPLVRATLIEEPGLVVLHTLDPALLADLERQVHYLLRDRFRPRDRRTGPLPIDLLDSAAWQFRTPEDLDPERRRDLARRAFEAVYLRDWTRRPRLGLGPGQTPETLHPTSPREAARLFLSGADPSARARLEGVVRLREELANRPAFRAAFGPIEFDALRRALGLETPHPLRPDQPTPIGRLDPDALDALDPDALDDADLAAACHAAIRPSTATRLADALERRRPDRLTDPTLRPVAESLILATLSDDGPEAAAQRIERWRAAAPDDSARAFLDRLRAEVALAGFGDEDDGAARLTALARGPVDEPEHLAQVAALLRDLGDHETATQALGRALHAAERSGDLPTAARLWDALGRPPRDATP